MIPHDLPVANRLQIIAEAWAATSCPPEIRAEVRVAGPDAGVAEVRLHLAGLPTPHLVGFGRRDDDKSIRRALDRGVRHARFRLSRRQATGLIE